MLSLIYKYLLKGFLNTFVFALGSLSLIFVIVDLMEKMDKFIDNGASFMNVAEYYMYFLPDILKLMTPIAVLLATLFSMGKFSTNNEITAMKSGGVSLYQIMLPYVLMSLVISLSHLYFNGWIVPRAETHKLAMEYKYLARGNNNKNLVNIHFRDTPFKNVLIGFYNADEKKGINVAIENYSDELHPRLKERIECNNFKWLDKENKWMAYNALKRIYNQDGSITMMRYDSLPISLGLTHNEMVKLKMSTKEMNYEELRDYISLLKKGGKDTRKQMIEYYGNFAFPFSNLIVVLFGVPFASVRRKGGIAIQISAALVVSFLYILFMKVSQTIGFYAGTAPLITGWFANILFLLGSLVVLWRTRT